MAKIPFSLKYRPQIESGEYKVIYLDYTEEESPARIICWDRHNEYSIVALISNSGGYERVQMFQGEGIDSNNPPLGTLFIVTPEEELTEWEKTVKDRLWRTLEYSETFRKDEDKWVRELAAELLAIAEKELHENMKEALRAEYEKGRADALKDLPRWKKCDPHTIYDTKCNFVVNGIGRYIILDGYMINVDRLEKLPGFKDDESHE